jgi:ribosome-binding protein aMBF1 (putative translation factor)
MGDRRAIKLRIMTDQPSRLTRRRPRSFTEWRTLRRWGKLPPWETDLPGFLLREARHGAGLSQRMLADRLGITQQAVSRAERWESNPTFNLMRRWLAVCGFQLEIRLNLK